MKLVLKYRDKIVSFGLLPTIATLISLHLFPNTLVLGIGTGVSLAALTYGIFKMKDLNFFLLQGTVCLGICYFIRQFTSYQYLPKGSITPILELMLLLVAFVHITVPEIYKGIQDKLKLRNCFSYTLEAKTIVILSGTHLIILWAAGYLNGGVPEKTYSFMVYGTPIVIYTVCLLINIIGIRMALKEDSIYTIIRIAPICNGKIFLTKTENASSETAVWDVPLENKFEGPIEKSEKYARKIVQSRFPGKEKTPRPILRHKTSFPCSRQQTVSLFVYPLSQEGDPAFVSGKFFSFDEIEQNKENFSPTLLCELAHLKLAAFMWKEYGK